MNILPKKSWHVRTKANIERVRKDEAKAAEDEKEKQRRIALAESEARTEILRSKSRKRKREAESEDDESAATSQLVPAGGGHINFFQEEEDGIKKSGTNAEYEAEKKAEQEKQEKAIGLLTYLGQSAIEAQTSKPWYQTVPIHRQKSSDASMPLKEEFDLKTKWSLDPMKCMGRLLHQKEKISERDKGKMAAITSYKYRDDEKPSVSHTKDTNSLSVISPDLVQRAREAQTKLQKTANSDKVKLSKKKKKKEKDREKHKHKKKHKKKHKYDKEAVHVVTPKDNSRNSLPSTVTSGGKTIQQLRAERMRREQEERLKSEQLLAKVRGDEPTKSATVGTDERERRYNSQFNPDFVRRKKRKFDIDDYC